MTTDGNLLPRYIMMQKALLSSLRLKDVLDAAVLQFAELAGGAKVAIFLSDNESLALKLMAAKGYSDATLDQIKVLPFSPKVCSNMSFKNALQSVPIIRRQRLMSARPSCCARKAADKLPCLLFRRICLSERFCSKLTTSPISIMLIF